MMHDGIDEACSTCIGDDAYRVLVWWKKLKDADHLEDLLLDSNVILYLVLKIREWECVLWIYLAVDGFK
jgi:hypothetical protein